MAKKYTMFRYDEEGNREEFVSEHIEQYGDCLFFKLKSGETIRFLLSKESVTWRHYGAINPENEYYLYVDLDTNYLENLQAEWDKMKEKSKK